MIKRLAFPLLGVWIAQRYRNPDNDLSEYVDLLKSVSHSNTKLRGHFRCLPDALKIRLVHFSGYRLQSCVLPKYILQELTEELTELCDKYKDNTEIEMQLSGIKTWLQLQKQNTGMKWP